MEGEDSEFWSELKEAWRFIGKILFFSLVGIGVTLSIMYYFLEAFER